VRPVGSERPRKSTCASWPRPIEICPAWWTKERSGANLFYRLNVIRIDVPPLRARSGDVEILARHFIAKHARGRVIRLSRSALDALSRTVGPATSGRLENELRRALVLADGVISPDHLSEVIRDGGRAEEVRSDGLNVRRRVECPGSGARCGPPWNAPAESERARPSCSACPASGCRK